MQAAFETALEKEDDDNIVKKELIIYKKEHNDIRIEKTTRRYRRISKYGNPLAQEIKCSDLNNYDDSYTAEVLS